MSASPIRRTPREHREAAGISRETLARRADVSTSTIVRLEDGHVPGALVLSRIAKALGLTVEDLLPDEPNGAVA
jgi:transcriptional regulator with XRE-family HTH domain